MELQIPLRGTRDLTKQIYQGMRTAILDGRLQKGEQLPATRELAAQLAVSRKTVTSVYDLLMSEGFLEGRHGSGTYVSDHIPVAHTSSSAACATTPLRMKPFWERAVRLPLPMESGARYDFRIGAPDFSRFPVEVWPRLAVSFHGHPELQGYGPLREAIAKYVSVARAVVCGAGDVIVTNGAQQAFDLIAHVLVEPGTVVAMEDPGYPGIRWLMESHGARVMPVPVDREGIVVEQIPDAAQLVYVTPSHQFPMGIPMSLARRVALLEWAERHGAGIIEDDYDSEFRFEGRALESLQNLDQAGTVLYAGTFSKVLHPGLRLGYLIPPQPLREALVRARLMKDWYSNVYSQIALARFLEEGHFGRHMRRMRKLYAERRDAVQEMIRTELSEWLEPLPSVAGLHTTALMREGFTEQFVLQKAAEAGVGIGSLHRFCMREDGPQGITFGYGGIEAQAIREGLGCLRRALRSEASSRASCPQR